MKKHRFKVRVPIKLQPANEKEWQHSEVEFEIMATDRVHLVSKLSSMFERLASDSEHGGFGDADSMGAGTFRDDS